MSGRIRAVQSFSNGQDSSLPSKGPLIETFDHFGRLMHSLNRDNTTFLEFNPEHRGKFNHLKVSGGGLEDRILASSALTEQLLDYRFCHSYLPETDATTHWYFQKIGAISLADFQAEIVSSQTTKDLIPDDIKPPSDCSGQGQLFEIEASQQTSLKLAQLVVSERLVEDDLHDSRFQPIILGVDEQGQLLSNFNWSNTEVHTYGQGETCFSYLEYRPQSEDKQLIAAEIDMVDLFFDNQFPSTGGLEASPEVLAWQQQVGRCALLDA